MTDEASAPEDLPAPGRSSPEGQGTRGPTAPGQHEAGRRRANQDRRHRLRRVPAPEPLDLRLVPAAVAAWTAAGWAVGRSAGTSLLTALVLAATATALVPATRRFRPARHRADTRPGADVPGGAARGSVAASALLVALTAACVLTVTAAAQHARSLDPLAHAASSGSTSVLTTTVMTAPRVIASSRSTTVLVELEVHEVDGQPSRASALVLGGADWVDVPLGAQVRVTGRPEAAEPGDAETAIIGRGAEVEVTAPPSGVLALVGGLREGLAEAVGAGLPDAAPSAPGARPANPAAAPAGTGGAHWPSGSRELVSGVALGDDHALPQRVREQMRAVSLTHLTAVSGQHVALVVGLVLAALGPVPRRWRALLGALLLVALVVLVRPGGSMLRAAVMGAVMLAGVAVGRRSASVPALCTAVVLLVLLDPWASRSYGFALSVTATAGILLGARPVQAALSRRLPRWLAAALALPLVAQAACAPVLVMLQPQVGLWAVPANVVAAPPVPVATVCGLLAALVSPLSPGLARLFAWPALASCAWLAVVARFFSCLPGAVVSWPGGVGGSALLVAIEAVAAVVVSRRARHRLRQGLRQGLRCARRRASGRRSASPARGRLGPWPHPEPRAAPAVRPQDPPGTRSTSLPSSSSAPARRSSRTGPWRACWPRPARRTRRRRSPPSRPPPTSPTS
ncbi:MULTISPECIES: ComEC/Rec2 family competence protein [unclassified Actinomyces]|uniref:ComEC/Rec2 family competence protein n=2 Tax=Actinomyces TaxID=1654 RepID=UPI002016F7E5|nr:ComEC/Rec2 family competence protein [Actinomyces sp. 187325]